MWTAFTDSQAQVILFHAIGFALACFIVYQGIAGGIEKFCKVAIPALFIILVGLAIYAVTLDGANQGLQYLFTVKKEYILSPNTWIQAFIQAAWSTGAGWGFIITYANYVGEEEDVPTSCLIMGLGDNLGAILSALVVIPAICALSATPEAGMKRSVRETSDLHLFTFISYLQQSRAEDSFPLSSLDYLQLQQSHHCSL